MNGFKIGGIAGALACLAYILVPHSQAMLVFSQSSPSIGMGASPPPTDVIRLNPNRVLRQKVWIPAVSISRLDFNTVLSETAALPVGWHLQVLADNNGQAGRVLTTAVGKSIRLSGYQAISFNLSQSLPVQEDWVWVELASTSDKPVYVYRDISDDVYPQGVLWLEPPHIHMHGVVAFALYSQQASWASPVKGMLGVVGVLVVLLWLLDVDMGEKDL